jgi:hypothetical protein
VRGNEQRPLEITGVLAALIVADRPCGGKHGDKEPAMKTDYTVKKLVTDVRFEDAWERIEMYYGDSDTFDAQKREQLAKAYEQLRSLDAGPNEDEMTLWIWVYIEGGTYTNMTAPRVWDFRESDYESRRNIIRAFSVCGVDMHYDNDIRYSYSGSAQWGRKAYENYLGFYIEDETMEGFSKESILAHLLWDFCK